MNEKNNKLKLDLLGLSEPSPKYRSKHGTKYQNPSKHGTKYQNGLRYPNIPNVYGAYEYNLSIFDFFVQFIYDEHLSKDPNMKWPSTSEDERKDFVRELVIDQVWKRHYNTLGNPFNYSTMAPNAYNYLMLCCNELDHKLNISFREFVDEFRIYKRPSSIHRGEPASKLYTKPEKEKETTKKGKFNDWLALILLIGSIALAGGSMYLCLEKTVTSFEELEAMMDKQGFDEDKKIQEIAKLVPNQDENLKYIHINSFPGSDDEISQANDKFEAIINEEGTDALLIQYLKMVNNLDSTTVTKQDIADFYVASYMISQLIPSVELCQAIDNYNATNPDNPIPTENVASITPELREPKDNPHGIYTITYKDSSSYYLFPSETEKILLGDKTGTALDLISSTEQKMEKSYRRAKEGLENDDTTKLNFELNSTRHMTASVLDMITSHPVIKKGLPLISSYRQNFDTKGISEKKFEEKLMGDK